MTNYSHFEAGAPAEWTNWKFEHPRIGRPTRGKLFLAEALGLTGMEVSFNTLPQGVALPFLHTHREHEELYVFISGEGEFQVDGARFPVRSGSSVRVAPAGRRSWRNTGDQPLVYIVVQAKAGSVGARSIQDGVTCPEPAEW